MDIAHGDVVSEMTAQFLNGDANTFLLNNLRDFRDANVHQGQYFTALSQTGELGIGYLETNGNLFTAVQGEFLPTGPLGPDDIVKMRTEVSGSTILHSAWLDGMDPSSGASVTWTDPLDRYPTGDLVAIGFVATGNTDAEVNVHSYSLTLVPEPTGVSLLLSSLLALPLLCRRLRALR